MTITPNAGAPDKALFGGYVFFTPQGGGQSFAVPYAGFKGDYQSIQAITPTANNLPWLSRLTACTIRVGLECTNGGVYQNQPAGATYTMSTAGALPDLPYILIHFEHQVQRLVFEVNHAGGGRVHPVYSDVLDQSLVARNSTASSFFAYPWDGTRLHDTRNDPKRKVVPDGQYVITVRALKALGDPGNPAHWETWTSPVITIDRP